MSKDKKKKKQKVTYIDDGRTIADMSGVRGGKKTPPSLYTSGNSLRDQGKTFLNAMRMMFKPMLITMGIICIAFFIVWLLLTLSLS